MLSVTHYAQNHADIIGSSLYITALCVVQASEVQSGYFDHVCSLIDQRLVALVAAILHCYQLVWIVTVQEQFPSS